MPKAVYFEGVIALKSSCNVHLSHITYAHFKAHFKAHFIVYFRFFGNRFRFLGNLNSPLGLLFPTFASRPIVVEI